MRPSKFTDEQVRAALHEVRDGTSAVAVCRRLGITETTFYRWRAKHDAAASPDVRRIRELEDENRRLKQLVADLVLHSRTGVAPRGGRR